VAEQADPGQPVLANTPVVGAATQVWPVARPPAAWASVVLVAALALVEAALVQRWLSLPRGLAAVASAPLVIAGALIVATLAVHTWSCLKARFVVNATKLTINRGTAHWVVPLSAISHISSGEPGAVLANRLLVPGFRAGIGYIKEAGPATFLTTAPLAQSVTIYTASGAYVISPTQPGAFAAALEERRVGAAPAATAVPGAGFLDVIMHPAMLALLAASALLDYALFAYVTWWYPALPAQIPLGPDPAGAPAGAAFHLPQIGALVLVTNLLLAVLPPLRRPISTATLLGATLAVQVFLWVAFLTLLP
jgi:hypothetical protein